MDALLPLIVLACALLAYRLMAHRRYRNLSPSEARALIDAGEVFLVDVREPAEWSSGWLPTAQRIPYSQFSQRLGEIPRDRDILVYCAGGVRSRRALLQLARAGYSRLGNLDGGIFAWKASGYEVAR